MQKNMPCYFFLGEGKSDPLFKRILIEDGNKEDLSFAEIFLKCNYVSFHAIKKNPKSRTISKYH